MGWFGTMAGRCLLWLLRLAISLTGTVSTYVRSFVATGPVPQTGTVEQLPNHICIAILEAEVHTPDVARMVLWAAMAGIQWITVWDPHGRLKSQASELEESVLRLQQEQDATLPFQFYVGGCSIKESVSQKTISVSILSSEDGRGDIVQAARSISAAVRKGEINSEDLTVANFSDWLNVRVPDLDLVLKFGDCDSLLGILPWQLRVSEIIKHRTHRDVPFGEFSSWLKVFSKINRRLGK